MHRASNPLNDDAGGPLLGLRFGPFELDVRSGELRRNGTTLRLQPQPLKVLVLLARRAGDVVTREEIQSEVWPAGTYVDFEQSLNFCIRQIRFSLGDNANAPRYVETLPRRGYRWVGGPVEKVTAGPAVREWPRPVPEPEPDAEPAVGPEPAPERALRPDGRALRRLGIGIVGLALAVAAAFLALRWLPGRSDPEGEPPSFQRLTFRRGSLGTARFGPGGQLVYTAAWDGGKRILYSAEADTGAARALPVEDAMVAAVSPSGEVAFLRHGVLARAPLAGGPPKEVLKDVVAADWAADGGDFAVVRYGKGDFRLEYPVGRPVATLGRVSRVRISPDGRYIAVAEHPILDDDRGLVAILDRDGRRVAATEEWASLDGIAWSADGSEVWLTAAAVGADNAVHALALDGRVRSVFSGMGRLVIHEVAGDGRMLLERTTLRSEILFRRAGEPRDRELSWLDFSSVESISPDGRTILFYESGQGGGPGYATFLRGTDGSPPVRVGSGRALGLSPDGAWVLSVSVGKPDHVDLVPTGPGEERQVRVPGVVAHEEGGFVGDGRIFVTGREAGGQRGTWILDADGRQPRRLPLPEGRILAISTFSADGSRFVASCPEGGTPCFYDTAAGNPVPVPGVEKGWWPVGFDTRGNLYLRDRSRWLPEVLLRLDLATGRVTPIAELEPRDRAGVLGIRTVFVASSGDAWAYNISRRLSDLHVVTGLN